MAPNARGWWLRAAAMRRFGPQNAKGSCSMGASNRTRGPRTMHPRRMLPLCALPMALSLLLAPARAQVPEPSKEEAPPELPADAPLDLSTPEPEAGALKPTTPLADKPSTPEWINKAGIDYSKPAIPAVTFQPDQLLAGAVPDQSTGVGWATITAPGLEAPLGWTRPRSTRGSIPRRSKASSAPR